MKWLRSFNESFKEDGFIEGDFWSEYLSTKMDLWSSRKIKGTDRLAVSDTKLLVPIEDADYDMINDIMQLAIDEGIKWYWVTPGGIPRHPFYLGTTSNWSDTCMIKATVLKDQFVGTKKDFENLCEQIATRLRATGLFDQWGFAVGQPSHSFYIGRKLKKIPEN